MINIDFETYSTTDLKHTGVYRYVEDPNTNLWCMAYAIDDGDVDLWVPGEPLPDDVLDALEDGAGVRAWNATFERVVWNAVGVNKHGFPMLERDRFYCTQADALAMGLPAMLGKAAAALRLPVAKDMEGNKLAKQMSRPRSKPGVTPIVWWNTPDRLTRLFNYCKQDVRTETAAMHATRRLSDDERAIWLLDQLINDRGVHLDQELMVACKHVAVEGLRRANIDISRATDGKVERITQIQRIKTWLDEQDFPMPEGLGAGLIEDALQRDDVPPKVRQVLVARSEAGKASVSKLDKMKLVVTADGNMHGLLKYHAAHTGRWGGRLVQPQNFTRGTIKSIEEYIQLMSAGYDVLNLFDNPIEIVSSMLRSHLVAKPRHRLISADFSAIEARVLAWLAGQQDLVEAFAAHDRKEGEEVYVLTANQFGIQRNHGKAIILGAGFGMGGDKFLTMGQDVYRIDFSEIPTPTGVAIEPGEIEGTWLLHHNGNRDCFESRELCISHAFVKLYRQRNPFIVQFWRDIQNMVLNAVLEPGSIERVGAICCVFRGRHLWLRLPSGRFLCYIHPRIRQKKTPWGTMQDTVVVEHENSLTHKWTTKHLYGGLLAENIVQAAARDLMAYSMQCVEEADYPIVLTVHDEIVADVPLGHGTYDEYTSLMERTPAWAEGCPVKVAGWEGHRYRKD